MPAFWSGPVATLLDAIPEHVVAQLARAQARHFRLNEATQLRAWEETLALLRTVLWTLTRDTRIDAGAWQVLLELPLLRVGIRPDVVLATPRGVFVLELKVGATRFDTAAREQVEDYAIDLQDFHAGSRHHPVIPVLVAPDAPTPAAQQHLALPVAWSVLKANAATLAPLLADTFHALPDTNPPLDVAGWEAAPYRPVPGLVQAATMLYARHGVADILASSAGATNLTTTTDAIHAALVAAAAQRRHVVLFVTGIPGAGKTLCGLNTCLATGIGAPATFLTGNPALVHVLREALARDAIERGMEPRAARQRMSGVIQALPRFRDHHAGTAEVPAEQVVVIDEAQRSWSRAHAIRKTLDRPVRLTDSEPGHLLDAMRRHEDWAGIVCLVGGGQEIHDGEGGLAEWGAALASRPDWQVLAAPDTLAAPDPRQRLPGLPALRQEPALHLRVPMRQLRSPDSAAWVDAVLAGDAATAVALAHGDIAFALTRSLAALREALRRNARGTQRAGLLASSGARRLRAEGLGAELPHMDAGAVAHWFLDRFPRDVRASDALELVATEFSVQGLELDHVGLCWDADLVRLPGQQAWSARAFRGTDWQAVRSPEAIANRVNTYRVLLTRARRQTIIWVPEGSSADRTRDPARLDAIAAFLAQCGARPLDDGHGGLV